MSLYQYLQQKSAWIEPSDYRLWQTFTPISYQEKKTYYAPVRAAKNADPNQRYRRNSARQLDGSTQFDARERYSSTPEPARQLLTRIVTTPRLRDNFTGYEYIHDHPMVLRVKHFALLFASTLLHPFAIAGLMLVDSFAMSYCFARALVTAPFAPVSSLDYCRIGAKIGIAMLSKPMGWLGLVASNTIGLLFPNTGRKLYANLERDLYWNFVFAPCFQPASSAYMAGAFRCAKPIDRRTSDDNGDIEHLLGSTANKANAW